MAEQKPDLTFDFGGLLNLAANTEPYLSSQSQAGIITAPSKTALPKTTT
jgi:hypothetical protein